MDRTESRRRWRKVEAACLLAISLSLFVILPIAQTLIPPVLIFGVLYLVLALLVFRFTENRWIPGIAAALVVIGILANAPFLIEDLAHPESWGGFMPAAVTVPAAIGAVIAAVMSYRAPTAQLARPIGIGVAGVVVVLVALSGVMFLTSDSAEAQPGDLIVAAEEFEYPETLSHAAGAFGITVENADAFRHTFVVEDQDVKLELPSNKTRRVEVDLAVGTYRFFCDVPGHEDMEGTLTLQ
jgi:uncharacterized cupredoxin-like copper-binding protein